MRRAVVVSLLVLLTVPAQAQTRFTPKEVEAAIQKGATWLKTAKVPTRRFARRGNANLCGYDLGYEALTCFALLRSGVSPQELEPRFAKMRRFKLTHTYCVSAYVLALEARHVQRVRLARRKRRKNQTYVRVAAFKRKRVKGRDADEIARAARWLLQGMSGKGVWTYSSYSPALRRRSAVRLRRRRIGVVYDHSNTQFAIYALHAAAAAGVRIPASAWAGVAEHFVNEQSDKGEPFSLDGVEFGRHAAPRERRRGKRKLGKTSVRKQRKRDLSRERGRPTTRGWGYRGKGYPSASMTAAGLSCLSMAEERLLALGRGGKLGPVRRSLRDGLAWLVKSWAPSPNNRGHRYYYLWSAEKAFSMTGVERIAPDRHWWVEGTSWLLGMQRPDGSWGSSMSDTCFALLFLNRATLPVWEEGRSFGGRVRTGKGRARKGPWDIVRLKSGARVSVSEVLRILRKASDKTAREVLAEARKAYKAMPREDRVQVLPELAELLDAERMGTRGFARTALKELLGTYDPEEVRRHLGSWQGLTEAIETLDPSRVNLAQAILRGKETPRALKRLALHALVRLRAAEATGDMIDQLEDKDVVYRRYAWSMLFSLAGAQRPFTPAGVKAARKVQLDAWRSWWRTSSKPFRDAEAVRRDVLLLAHKDRTAQARVRLLGKGMQAVPRLIATLADASRQVAAHDLLRKITRQDLPAEARPWRAWLRSQR